MATRRFFLATAAAWWSQAMEAAHQHTAPPNAARGSYKFLFFQPMQVATLRSIAAVLVPADERSGGAAAARVEEYIDFVLAHGAPALKDAWRKGLATYSSMSESAIEAKLREASNAEFNPKTESEKFFVLVKGAVVEAFYTSEEGINKELSYQGMKFLMNFEGCTHTSHAIPEGYQPLVSKEPA
jgi:Gluconate 2-dehydrogenase subunit 3